MDCAPIDDVCFLTSLVEYDNRVAEREFKDGMIPVVDLGESNGRRFSLMTVDGAQVIVIMGSADQIGWSANYLIGGGDGN